MQKFSLCAKAIVLPEHGWYLTAEAVKFCLEHKIDLISVSARSSQGEKGLMTVVAGHAQNNAALVRARPVNALLNWSYAVVAGRLAAQLLARGAYLGIGYLHADSQDGTRLSMTRLRFSGPSSTRRCSPLSMAQYFGWGIFR